MRKLTRLIAGVASVAAAAALVAGTVTAASAATNDPPKGVTPAAYDIVGVGSNTTQYVMDALLGRLQQDGQDSQRRPPALLQLGRAAQGRERPRQLQDHAQGRLHGHRPAERLGRRRHRAGHTQKVKSTAAYQCIDFARSSGGRKPTNPRTSPAASSSSRSPRTRSPGRPFGGKGGTDAPASLTTAQLKGIFTCTNTNWTQVGGKNGAIKVYLPQAGSGTLSTWEKFMGITTLGSCVSQAPEENEGTYAGFNSPNAIFIYSIGAYVAQKYHSAACNARRRPRRQNKFGCNLTGFLAPSKISGVNPLSSAKVPTINPKFPAAFWRTVYNVVNYWTGTKDHMSPKVERIFGSRAEKGYLCTNAGAQTLIKDYGFVTTGLCGSTS